MEKYMGFRANAPQEGSAGELAKINIKGTLFYIDLVKHEFRQVDDPFNRMSLGDIQEEMGFSHFLYDTQTKNKYLGNYAPGDKMPDNVCIVLVPPLKDIDPVGLARRQGLPVNPNASTPKRVQSLTTLAPKTKVKARNKKRQKL